MYRSIERQLIRKRAGLLRALERSHRRAGDPTMMGIALNAELL